MTSDEDETRVHKVVLLASALTEPDLAALQAASRAGAAALDRLASTADSAGLSDTTRALAYIADVADALRQAAAQGVENVLVLELSADNPGYTGSGRSFSGASALRLTWHAEQRTRGASLHAKILVVDDAALVGGANLTDSAMNRNIECGLLRDGPQPARPWGHVLGLRDAGMLRQV